jgi:hypothetical protein
MPKILKTFTKRFQEKYGNSSGIHPIRRPLNTIVVLCQVAYYCSMLKPILSLGFIKLFFRTVKLCNTERFLPREAYAVGLLSCDLSIEEKDKYLSRKKLTKLQRSVNPESWSALLNNKAMMYRYCMMSDIKIPQTFGIFMKNNAGMVWSNKLICSKSDWCNFIEHQLPVEFVIKPIDGSFGRGIKFLTRTSGGHHDQNGRVYQAGEIYDLMNYDSDSQGYVIQQKLDNHPEIVHLTGTGKLQTIRIITFVDRFGNVRILQAHLKMVTGDNYIDSFVLGATGNIQADIDIEFGLLNSAIAPSLRMPGVVPIYKHPDTEVTFDGFRMPCWTQACELVTQAAKVFLPIRSIGWDIAITPSGPVVIEGNYWWNPPNQHKCMSEISSVMLQG